MDDLILGCILVVLVLVILFALFMIARNEWVYRVSVRYIDQVDKYMHHILATDPEPFPFGSIDTYYDALYPYDKMVNLFWIWDASKLVRHRDTYNTVVNHQCNQEATKCE